MGTWGKNIHDNDTFQDIYTSFFYEYNLGRNPIEISKKLIEENKDIINDIDDSNHFWFALSLAQWETKSLDPKIHLTVKEIIKEGKNIEQWKDLDINAINERQKYLTAFLAKIETKKEKAKKRVKPKVLDYYSNELITLMVPDQNKIFSLSESGTSKGHNNTGGYINWFGKDRGVGSVLFYGNINRNISAKWINSQTLVIRHPKEIVFTKQDFQTQNFNDIIKIIYEAV